MRLKGKTLNLDYTKWIRSPLEVRRVYLKSVGLHDEDDVTAIVQLPFHLLPYTVRTQLQTRIIGQSLIKGDSIWHFTNEIIVKTVKE